MKRLATAIVEDHQVTLAQGFGVRALGSEDGEIINGLMYELPDHYLGQPNADWPAIVTRFDDKTMEPAYVTFGLIAEGHVGRITLKPVQDLLFTPLEATP